MKLYVFDKDTKELKGTIQGLLDPLESQRQGREIYAIPPFTTPIYPEKFEDGKINVYNEKTKLWSLIEDHRDVAVFDKKGNALIIKELGEVPEGYSLEKPYIFQEAKAEKAKEIDEAYNEAYDSSVKINKILFSIRDLTKINEALNSSEKGSLVTLNLDEPIILEYEKLAEIKRLLQMRSLLLPIRRKELLSSLKSTRNRTQLDNFSFSFDIEDEVKEKAKLSEEEFNNYIRENM